MRFIVATATAVVCLGYGAAAAGAATTRYVAAGGRDQANNCSNPGTPCRTVSHAAGAANSGDTIRVGPGHFYESVSATGKDLTFIGAGAGTPSGFNPATETFIDATNAANPAFTLGNHNDTFQALRIQGGVGSGPTIEPAISSTGGASIPALSVTDCVLLQTGAVSPGAEEFALQMLSASGSARVSVTGSTVQGFAMALRASGSGGSLTVTNSKLVTPAPAQSGPILPLGETVLADVPTTISRSTITGITGIRDSAASMVITHSAIKTSGEGLALEDTGNGPSLTIRDSVVGPASSTMPFDTAVGIAVGPGLANETVFPSLSLIFDSVLAISRSTPVALSVKDASGGTSVFTRNTILSAIVPGFGSGASDIAGGNQAIVWDLGYTDYRSTSGIAVPAPGSGTNIDADPDYMSIYDLRLGLPSPLFDRGDPAQVQAGETDLAGRPRSVPHVCFGTALPDLGAFETDAPNCPAPTISVGSPTSDATYTQGQSVDAAYACVAPAPATLTGCSGPVASGQPIDAHTIGRHTFTVTASASDGASATQSVTYTVKLPVPSLGTIHASHHTFREGSTLAHLARMHRPPVGTTFSFTLNTQATLKLAFTHRVRRRNVSDGSITLLGYASTERVAFDGRLSKRKKLAPGTYALTVTATNSSGRSRSRSTSFTVAR